jgi:hypothetical protein
VFGFCSGDISGHYKKAKSCDISHRTTGHPKKKGRQSEHPKKGKKNTLHSLQIGY